MATLIFDIGKTNKKVFVFNEKFEVVFSEQQVFEEIQDEEGFPCDDLLAIQNWIQATTKSLLLSDQWNITKINFSTYGASFVHLNELGNPITPLMNYLKPMPEDCSKDFYHRNGAASTIALETASPALGMLNSGLQIIWWKYKMTDLFSKIKTSLHFPQYLSYCFTKKAVSEYTSIGCHTALWDFQKKEYHDWVKAEGIINLLSPLLTTSQTFTTKIHHKEIEVGVGIHDSSAALLTYLEKSKEPFLLISTGTWSIALNPFNEEPLTAKELEQDCLNYLQADGKPVKAARLFLGQEYEDQTTLLMEQFNCTENDLNAITFDEKLIDNLDYHFNFNYLSTPWNPPNLTDKADFQNIKAAYHQLMYELVELQFYSAQLAIGNTAIKKIFIDGGFVKNKLYLRLLKNKFPNIPIQQMENTNGSALGAALVINQKQR